MDKAVLKNFAVESRKDLMEKIDRKIKLFYIDEEFKKDNRGDVIVLSNDKHTLTLTKEDDLNRDKLIKRIVEYGYEQVVEEAAYTWFNRIIAIRYMEIHDFLPLTKDNLSLGIRVLSSNDNKVNPEILKFSNLINPEIDIAFDKEKYSQFTKEDDRFKYILILLCKKLCKVIPNVFGGVTDYIDLLIPDNMLSENGLIFNLVNQINESNFREVEIIGWLYQFYISEKKDEVFEELKNHNKITKENIPAATQLFTPDWVVKYMVQNSLGRLWIENSNDKQLTDKWKYYIKSSNKNEKIESLDIENIKVIDPCCGSGHILVYMFEVLYQIYVSLGYKSDDIPKLIIENNINGLDIDDRACQLSTLSILLKAREYDKKIFNKRVETHILSIQESNSLDRNTLELLKSDNKDVNDLIDYIYDAFYDAKEYGSLIKIKLFDFNIIKELIEKLNKKDLDLIELSQLHEINEKYCCLVEQAILLSQKYDVTITNPPYMGQSGMNRKLVEYLKDEYKVSKSDLFAIFIEVALNMTKKNRYTSMITMQSWMFLSSYLNIRERIIFNNEIINMVHLGAGAFEELNAFNVLTTMFVIKNNENSDNQCTFVRLNKVYNTQEKEKEFFNKNNYYLIPQKDLKEMPNYIIGYWISDKMKEILKSENTMEKLSPPRTGMMTTDNKRFLRMWYESNINDICFDCASIEKSIESEKKWFPYIKGGNFRRWYGNRECIVNWYNGGQDIRNNGMTSFRGKDYYFKEGITWSIFGFENFCARYSPVGSIFDIAGTSTFPPKKMFNLILGLLNSKIAYQILILLNPSVNFQNGDIKKIPIVIPNDEILEEINSIVEENIKLSKDDWDSYETSWDFKKDILYSMKKDKKDVLLSELYNDYEKLIINRFNKLKSNEEKLNKIFINLYGLNDELESTIEDKEVTVKVPSKLNDIKSLISYAVGCMFGRYSLDTDGIIYAGGEFDLSKYKSIIPDKDNVIPISDDASVYYKDDIVDRFIDFIKTAFGSNYLNENLNYVAECLGKKGTETSEQTIRRYFISDFYSDHLKTYQKKPIYWLFDSGKKNGFKCLVYIHRYDKQLVSRIRVNYLHKTIDIYKRTFDEINNNLQNNNLSVTDKRELQNKKSELNSKIIECNEYEEKVGNVANKMIELDLDDGIEINYAKLVDDNRKSILAKIK